MDPFCFLILLWPAEHPRRSLRGGPARHQPLVRGARHITLPCCGRCWLDHPAALVEALKIIDIPFALTAGGPGRANETFSIFIYRTAFTGFDVGYASAASFLFLIIVLAVVNVFVIFGRFRSSWEYQAR